MFLQQLVTGISVGGIYALLATGYSLIYSLLDFSNWAHGEFAMVSAYVAIVLSSFMGMPFVLAAIGGMMGGVMMVWLTAGLWHSGFTKLDYPKLCRIAVPLLFMAAVSRAFLMNVNPIFFITVPALMTAAVFVLYLFTFVPIFRENAFTDDPE